MNIGVLTLLLDKDSEIIAEYSSGDKEKAATSFVRKYQNFVYATAFRYLKSYDDADDAAQEVFIKALNNIHKFRGDSSIQTWLYRITFNVCTNITRKKKIRSIFRQYDDIDDDYFNIPSNDILPDKLLEDIEFKNKFHKELAKLPEKQRETFALRYFDELSYNEISKMLGTSVGGLKANYYQAVKKLAENFNKEIK